MAAASGEAAAAALLAQQAPLDDEDIGDFLARVEEVNAQIKLLKEGVTPDAVTTVGLKSDVHGVSSVGNALSNAVDCTGVGQRVGCKGN